MARRHGAQSDESWRFRPATSPPSAPWRSVARTLAAALLCAGSGCAGAGDAASRAAYVLNPFSGTEVTVRSVSLVGPYLLAEVTGRKEQLRLLAPASPECARVLQSEAEVRYQRAGHFGRLERGDESCDAVGVASLEAWRNRQPRRRASVQGVPRATARFSLVAESGNYLLVRGRFPLASEIRVPSGADLVALLPADEACRTAARRGQVSLEFRAAGRDPFRLLVGREACVIEGFATPIDAAR
jgi:hypothetical protein